MSDHNKHSTRDSLPIVAVVGLGYVGLPLAVEFSRYYKTVGFDLSTTKIDAYKRFSDPSGEVEEIRLKSAVCDHGLHFTDDPSGLALADFLIVAVPTPVDSAHIPDFSPLLSASTTIGQHLKRGATVVYESTVFPGATEEVCIPALEQSSRRKWKTDFNVGYSPERINPGDKEHSLTKIVKVVAGDTEETLCRVAEVYGRVIEAGVHRAPSIKVAEAAKVIENTQRDLNIALMNELSIIFDKMDIDTRDVLQAAGTKWNFLKFTPGLVGGHCIGVDPYYLTHKAEMIGYHPQVILAGRRINDGMGKFIAERTVKLMIQNGQSIKGAKVLVLGLTFKEDCPDLRNSKVIDVVNELKDFGCEVTVHDPIADPEEAVHEYDIDLVPWNELPFGFDAVVIAVAHKQFKMCSPSRLLAPLKDNGVISDIKWCLAESQERRVWRL